MPNPLGLSQNAWRNAKSYAATAFPGNPTEGDRILRTDVGSGIWFTYVTALWVPDNWAAFAVLTDGTAVTTGASNTTVTYNFPLGAGFNAAPRVVISLANAPAGSERLVVRQINGTTTGFTAQIRVGNGVSSTWTGLVAHYSAIPAAPA